MASHPLIPDNTSVSAFERRGDGMMHVHCTALALAATCPYSNTYTVLL